MASPAVKHFKLVIAGAGTGGCSTASRFLKKLGAGNVALIDPAEKHYYQPMWTLVGGGMKTFAQSERNMSDVIPKNAHWIKNSVVEFQPDNNTVVTGDGNKVTYDYLIVALGIKLNFDHVKGLPEAMRNDPAVCSNYSAHTVNKTFKAIERFSGGKALFTFPNTPIKCAGAPQKIMYIFEDYLRKNSRRDKADIKYFTSLGAIFGIKRYAETLAKICSDRNIEVNVRHHLIQIDHEKNEATFEHLDTKEIVKHNYNFIHVTPPMGGQDCLKNSPLVDDSGFVSVDKLTLQHTKYPNVFGVGDCTNLPTAKTAAGVSYQNKVVYDNLSDVMDGKKTKNSEYDGYASCPLITGYNRCVLAEFGYDGVPLETMPINQAKERYSSFLLKAHFMPPLYWKALLTGYWGGPKPVRKLFHLGLTK